MLERYSFLLITNRHTYNKRYTNKFSTLLIVVIFRLKMGHAVKIIEIAEGNQTFHLNEGALKKILHEVPEGLEIAIVSVVSLIHHLDLMLH